MRTLLFGATVLLAVGLAYSGNSIHAETTKDAAISGKVTAIYGSDIIALDGYNGHIVLTGFADETADKGRPMLQNMIGDEPVTCRHKSYDEYGRMVASCVNADGKVLKAGGDEQPQPGFSTSPLSFN